MTLQDFIDNEYITIDNEKHFEISDFSELVNHFDGYQKVVFSLLINYFKLPQWKTLIFKDLNDKNSQILKEFIKNDHEYFVRTDTINEYISNISYIGTADKVFEFVQKAKEIEDRYMLILESPKMTNSEFKNKASGRTGIINGDEIQEWVGPGFSEYHLSKDQFPDYCTLHSLIKFDDTNKYKSEWQIEEQKLKDDVDNLLIAVSVKIFKLKKKFFDKSYYKQLTNMEIAGEQTTQDEAWLAFDHWKKDIGKKLDLKQEQVELLLRGFGREYLLNLGKNESTLCELLTTEKKTWQPEDCDIQLIHNYLDYFIHASVRLGINPSGKLLTYSMKNHEDDKIVFWDIHNLNLSDFKK